MSQVIVKGMQSEIFAPITPPSIFTPVTKELKNMKIAIASAAGIHLKSDKRFNLAGDFGYRLVPGDTPTSELMVSHGGYDNGDVNKDINCMFPLDRLRELKEEGLIAEVAETQVGFMGGGGNQQKFTDETGPAIAKLLKDEGVDGVIMTAG